MALEAKPAPARSVARVASNQIEAVPDYVAATRQSDKRVTDQIGSNPVYQVVIEGNATKEDRVSSVTKYLLAGLADGTTSESEMDRRRVALTEINTFVQILRRQLGSEQARAITDKAHADYQRIINATSEDVAQFEEELDPLGKLAELMTKYGADGNIIDKINLAKEQKRERERAFAIWQKNHVLRRYTAQQHVDTIQGVIDADTTTLAHRWFNKKALEESIAVSKVSLVRAQDELVAIEQETAPETANSDMEQIDEGILELQNIGGPAFKTAVSTLRDHTELALAKISSNFDEAVQGLMNTRESFIAMDRTASDAIFALTVLETGVQAAEGEARRIAEKLVDPSEGISELDKMERERRSQALLTYTAALTTFLKNIGLAVTSLRSSQAVIQNVLRMNSLAIESANTHKITGIANTADAVTIIIGSIIDVCNRAASRTLADGLMKIRTRAEEGAARLSEGSYEALEQQNLQLEDFIDSVKSLRETTRGITANTVDLLKEQFGLVAKMREESAALADASSDAQRSAFNARAGVLPDSKTPAKGKEPEHSFGLHIPA